MEAHFWRSQYTGNPSVKQVAKTLCLCLCRNVEAMPPPVLPDLSDGPHVVVREIAETLPLLQQNGIINTFCFILLPIAQRLGFRSFMVQALDSPAPELATESQLSIFHHLPIDATVKH